MANTTNLDLVKPAGTDKALVSVINSNSDKIDAFAGTTNQALSTNSGVITVQRTTGNTNSYYKYVKLGNVVSVFIYHKISDIQIASGGHIDMPSIPIGYRPQFDIYARANTFKASSDGVMIEVFPSGVIRVETLYNAAMDTSDVIFGNVTYAVPY